ncbi:MULTISPECIES: DUF692 domain-containing protein [Pseudofrankia]|uniref:DUF692 domain-containing protein n=1 Tax=Pseudofrankia TaxID=2994363 RepID=UPI0012FF4444|nr:MULTISPECIES: DUF692 domain-containing protein [Pseudofrankia]
MKPRPLGYGIGWRPAIDEVVSSLPGLDFIEVIAEGIDPRRVPDGLMELRAHGVTIIPHGTTLNLGGAGPPDPGRLAHLAAVARALDAPLVSEHVALCRSGDLNSGHLLPVPLTRTSLIVTAENARIARSALPVPLAVENVAPLFGWPDDKMSQARFLAELVERADVDLLLDVANLRTAWINLDHDPISALRDLPLDRVAYVHVAGGELRDGLWHDTHNRPVPDPTLRLLAELTARCDPPGVLLERDRDYPPAAEIADELALIRKTVEEARDSRPATGPGDSRDQRARADGRRRLPTRRPLSRPVPDAVRQRLGHAQHDLLAALVGHGPVPAGFDAHRLAVQTQALAERRARLVSPLLPDVADDLDSDGQADS